MSSPRTQSLVLPSLLVLLIAYVLAHSPLRRIIGTALGLSSGRCYFSCSEWLARTHTTDALGALAALALAGVAASIVSGRFVGHSSDRAVVFGLTALAFATVPAAIFATIGWAFQMKLLRPPLGPVLASLPAAGMVAWGIANRRLPAWPRTGGRLRGLALVLAGLATLLLGASVVISLVHPPNGYDALSYHAPIAVYFWRDGDLAGFLERQPGAWALAHPGTAELWFGLLRLAGGEGAADLGQLPFALLGAGAVYAFARRMYTDEVYAIVGALGFLLAPMVVVQSGMQLNDLTAAAVLMAAMALTAAPTSDWTPSRLAAIGLALGLATTTKLAMVPAVLAVWLYLLASGVRARPRVKSLALAATTFAIVVMPWWVRNLVLFGNPIYPAALPFIGRGYVVGDFIKKDSWFVPTPLAWPLYPLVEPHGEMSGVGALFAVGALPGLLIALRVRPCRPLVLYGVVAAFSLPAWWLLTQHEPRLILPLFGMGFAFLGFTLLAVPSHHRARASVVLGAAACFSAVVTADQALQPLAMEPSGRWEFYDQVWGVDSTAATLPPAEGLLYHTGNANLSYAGDYPLLGSSLGRILAEVDSVIPTDSIVKTMKAQKLHYAYVPAAASAQAQVEAMYPPAQFELVHVSVVSKGPLSGSRRYLYRLHAK